MYCVKCKKKTETIDIIQTTTKNNRSMLKGLCSNCGSKKSQLVACTRDRTVGKGIGDTIIKAIGEIGELHLPITKGEYVPNGSFNNLQKYSYCGPGTKYEQRMREGYQGVNELDSMCKLHDQFYNENQDTESRNISDAALAHRAHEISNDGRFDDEQRRFAKFVNVIMKNKVRFGLGTCDTQARSESGVKTSKNVKKGPMK